MRLAFGIIGIIISGIAILLGLFVALLGFAYGGLGTTEYASSTTATVTDKNYLEGGGSRYGGGSYDLTVQYVVDEQTYNCVATNLPTTTSGIGETIKIKYNPDKPYDCSLKQNEYDTLIFAVVIVVFGVGGIIGSIQAIISQPRRV